jgi:Icc-related predicted phosphoesterase
MNITLISDTHNKHKQLTLKGGDLLIHAGDVSGRGYTDEVSDFLKWFSVQPYRHKIFIAGNHDFFFERKEEDTIKNIIPENVIYLNDSGCEIEGIKIWGSPVQPWFYDWAFNRQRGSDIKKHWDLIPAGTEILITHGPPYGILDRTVRDIDAGCEELLAAVKKIKPALHVFGHIHEAYGLQKGETLFCNVSVLDENYLCVNDPVDLEFPIKK